LPEGYNYGRDKSNDDARNFGADSKLIQQKT